MVMVDIGCGEGFFILPDRREGKVIGIDINADAVNRSAE
jgi:SAM-dependent methyltransferase